MDNFTLQIKNKLMELIVILSGVLLIFRCLALIAFVCFAIKFLDSTNTDDKVDNGIIMLLLYIASCG